MHLHRNSLFNILDFFSESPPLAMGIASPTIRLMTERGTNGKGYKCGNFKVSFPREPSDKPLIRTLAMTVTATSAHKVLRDAELKLGWWLIRTKSRLSLQIGNNTRLPHSDKPKERLQPRNPLTRLLPLVFEVHMTGCCVISDWISQCHNLMVLEIEYTSTVMADNSQELRIALPPSLQRFVLKDADIGNTSDPMMASLLTSMPMFGAMMMGVPFPNMLIANLSPVRGQTLSGLKEVDLTGSFIKGISCIAQAPSLASLNVNYANIHGGFGDFGRMQRLKELYMEDSHVSDIGWIVQLKLLERLSLSKTWILPDFSPIGRLRSLQVLDLSATRLTNISWIVGCQSITFVNLIDLHNIDGTCLTRLPNLKEVRISRGPLLRRGMDWIEALVSKDVEVSCWGSQGYSGD